MDNTSAGLQAVGLLLEAGEGGSTRTQKAQQRVPALAFLPRPVLVVMTKPRPLPSHDGRIRNFANDGSI